MLFLLSKNIVGPLRLFELSDMVIQGGVFSLCFLSGLIRGSDILVCCLGGVSARVSLGFFEAKAEVEALVCLLCI